MPKSRSHCGFFVLSFDHKTDRPSVKKVGRESGGAYRA